MSQLCCTSCVELCSCNSRTVPLIDQIQEWQSRRRRVITVRSWRLVTSRIHQRCGVCGARRRSGDGELRALKRSRAYTVAGTYSTLPYNLTPAITLNSVPLALSSLIACLECIAARYNLTHYVVGRTMSPRARFPSDLLRQKINGCADTPALMSHCYIV